MLWLFLVFMAEIVLLFFSGIHYSGKKLARCRAMILIVFVSGIADIVLFCILQNNFGSFVKALYAFGICLNIGVTLGFFIELLHIPVVPPETKNSKEIINDNIKKNTELIQSSYKKTGFVLNETKKKSK